MYECERMCHCIEYGYMLCSYVSVEGVGFSVTTLCKSDDVEVNTALMCGHGSKSPLFPDDHELGKEELIAKYGYDTESTQEMVDRIFKRNYTVDLDRLALALYINTEDVTADGDVSCAFNM